MMYCSRFLASLLLALVSLGAQAKTQDLGLIGANGKEFGNTFYTAGDFTDYYTFSIADTGTVSGSIVDTSYILFFTKDVVLKSLTLLEKNTLKSLAVDNTANSFSFSGLTSGAYTLAVNGTTSGSLAYVGAYKGNIKAVAAAVAAPAPEVSDLVMTAMGLGGVAWMVRRRRAVK